MRFMIIIRKVMRYLFYIFLLYFSAYSLWAANYPCSGMKGGVSHCQGTTFICNDGSVSGSKRNCQNYSRNNSSVPQSMMSTDMQPTLSNNCSCRSGTYCTGPRGGRYCYTDNGNKSYLRK